MTTPITLYPWHSRWQRKKSNGAWPSAGVAWERPVAAKVPGVRAGLIHDVYSAHQGVEDDNMNMLCMGGRVIGPALAWELVQAFVAARFSGAERHQRRLAKVAALENE